MTITFREITPDNFRAVARLKVAPGQEHFVADNVYSLAQAKVWAGFMPLAIYAGETPVGFVMYVKEGDLYYIIRLMVAAGEQQKGYGRAALTQLLAQFQADPDCRHVALSYEPENSVAARFYQSLGFVETGEVDEGELVARLTFDRGMS